MDSTFLDIKCIFLMSSTYNKGIFNSQLVYIRIKLNVNLNFSYPHKKSKVVRSCRPSYWAICSNLGLKIILNVGGIDFAVMG